MFLPHSAATRGEIALKLDIRKSFLCALVALPIAASGCVKMYTLPDAPPKSEWETAEVAKESPEEALRRFFDAKRAAIQCYSALADKKWDKAFGYMSRRTLAMFRGLANGRELADVFAQGTVWVDGEEMAFDPVGDVFIHGLTDIRDEFGGRKDREDEKRRVLYAIGSDGKAREIVFVFEEDKWRLDMQEFQHELLTE